MPVSPTGLPDWRDAGAYLPLLDIDRAGFAWEWLRRNARYREAARLKLSPCRTGKGVLFLDEDREAYRWGLHAFENPDLSAIDALPVWKVEAYPLVLPAVAEAAGAPHDSFDIGRAGDALLVRASSGAEHIVMSEAVRNIRLDILSGSVAEGPVRLGYLITGFASAEAPLAVLRRLLAFWRTGRTPKTVFARERRAARLVLALRVADALAAGAAQREIAAGLLSSDARGRRWRVNAPSTRSRVQRLVRLAKNFTDEGHLKLLASSGRAQLPSRA